MAITTPSVYHLDYALGSDTARTALTSCVVSDGTGKVNVAKVAHGLVDGAVVVGTLFTNYASNYLVQKKDNDNFYLCTGRAGGLISITGTPTVNDTFTINGTVFTFKAARSVAGEVTISSDQLTQFKNIIFAIVTDIGTTVDAVNISNSIANTNNGYINQVYVYAKTPGTGGNAYTFTCSSTGGVMTVSGSGTLSGGAYIAWTAGGTTIGTFTPNGGQSWTDAWSTITSGVTAARHQAGDIIKLAKSPTPYSIGAAQWTDQDVTLPVAKTISSIADNGSGKPRFLTSAPHGFSDGDCVYNYAIATSGQGIYNGTFKITYVDATHYDILAIPFGATATGSCINVNRLCVKLDTPRTKTITRCQSAWTGVNNGTATADNGTFNKDGYYAAKIVCTAGGATGTLQAYYNLPSTLNLAAYSSVTFWIYNTVAILGTHWTINLCSGVNGTTTVNTITIPAIPSTARGVPITISTGALGTSIASIALYSGSVYLANTMYLSDILACNDLSLTSLISKNQLEQSTVSSTNKGNEGWYGIQSISEDGLVIRLDNDTNTIASTGITSRGYGYSGATEKVATYAKETIKTAMGAGATTQIQAIQKAGVIGSNIIYQAGYNITNNIQDGETTFDTQNGNGYGIYINAMSYVTVNLISTVRYNYAYYLSNAFYNIIQTISNSNNNTSYGISLNSSYNNIIQNIINTNNNTSFGLYLTLSNNNTINILYANNSINNNIQTSNSNNNIIVVGNIWNGLIYGLEIDYGFKNTVTFTGTIKNIANFGFIFYSSSENKVYNATTLNNALGGLFSVNGGTNYMYNCLVNESIEYAGDTTKKGNSQVQSDNHDQTPNNHVTFFNYGYIQSFPNTLSNGKGLMWQLNITNAGRDSGYPYRHLLANYYISPANVGRVVQCTLWIKKSHATNIVVNLVYKAGQITGGTTVDILSPKANNTTEEQVVLQFTPTVSGVAEIELQAYWGGGSAFIYFDSIHIITL